MTEGGNTAQSRQRFGQYEILGTVGRGGMGVVYQALDLSLDRVVALKVLHDHLRARPQCVSRLQREARAIAGLNHPSIVQVYSVGEIGKVAYFVMEYVDGKPLSTVLLEGGPMPWQRALDIAGQTVDALTCAHDAGIVHRDVKPPNIILAEGDRVYVTDFGVAKVLTAETQLTVDASRLGTPSYMSPEHCQNVEVTAASDFYSLGVLIFQMISGRLPHEASSRAGLVNKIVGSPPARLRDYVPDVPEGVDRLVAHLLEKRPKDRPANGRVLCELIERVLAGGTLDEECRSRVAAMATLRQALIQDTPPKTPPSGGDDTGGRRRSKQKSTSSGADRQSSHHSWRMAPRRWIAGGENWRAAAWVLVVWGALCSATTGTILGQWQGPEFLDDGRNIGTEAWHVPAEVATFVDAAPGLTLARLNGTAGTPQSSGWVDAGGGVCVAQTSAGPALYRLDPMTRTASAHVIGDAGARGPVLDFGGTAHRDSPLAGRMVLDQGPKGLFAWPTPPSTASALPLAEKPVGVQYAPVAAVHPAGRAVALAVSGLDTSGRWMIVQQEMGFGGPSGAPRALTKPGEPVNALQYCLDGTRLAYLRDGLLGQRELWVVATDGSAVDGALVGRGALSMGPNAFSPDGTRIATVVSDQLQIHSSGGLGVELAGQAREAAWHPSGAYLVATAPDAGGRLQLWAVETRAPYRRKPLTQFEAGVEPSFRLSPDGMHALALVKATEAPEVAFLRLSLPIF